MSETRDEDQNIEKVGGIPVRSAVEEFSSDEMLVCNHCGRKVPPNRLDCLYCGKRIELTDDQKERVRPIVRQPEDGERGYSIVAFPSDVTSVESLVNVVAECSRLDLETAQKLIAGTSAVPFARGGDREVVESAARAFDGVGANTRVFSDEKFLVGEPQIRIKGIFEFDDGQIALIRFGTDELIVLGEEEVVMIVEGSSFETRLESKVKHKRKGTEKLLDESETAQEDMVLDLYFADSPVGCRIVPTGFDFSYLEDRKAISTTENMALTKDFLTRRFPNAVMDDGYRTLRSAISEIWGYGTSETTAAMKHRGFGSFERKKVFTRNNHEQFLRYSRLQWFWRHGETGAKDETQE